MSTLRTSFLSLTPESFWNWGRVVLGGAFTLGLLILVYLTWKGSEALLFFPGVLLGGAAALYLFRRPTLNLYAVLAGFVLVAAHTKGISALETLYALYVLTFLVHWFFTRLVLYQDRIFEVPEARALLLFLVGATALIPVSIFLGAPPTSVGREWIAVLFLGMYFPVRETCIRDEHAVRNILLLGGWIGIFVSLRNLMIYRAGLNDAEYLFEIAKGRVSMNPDLLMVVSIMALVFVVLANSWRLRLPLLATLLLFFGSLIITQSRALWVTFFLAAGVMFLLVRRPYKLRMLVLGVVGLGGIALIAILVLGDALWFVVMGLIDRVFTLGDAPTKDLSLWSRVVEARGAFARIAENPILGHGHGVTFRFFDVIDQMTVDRTFIHNGYVGLLYRFGVWGLVLVLYFWLRSAWRAIQAFRLEQAPIFLRFVGLGTALCLGAFVITTNTSNPFFLKDTFLIFGVLTGLASGIYERARLDVVSPDHRLTQR